MMKFGDAHAVFDLRPERIPIFESATGHEVAAILGFMGWDQLGQEVWLLEKKPGWLHVEGYSEFHFNGWIPATSVFRPGEDTGRFGMIGLLTLEKITHEVIVPFPLRIEATNTAPIVATVIARAIGRHRIQPRTRIHVPIDPFKALPENNKNLLHHVVDISRWHSKTQEHRPDKWPVARVYPRKTLTRVGHLGLRVALGALRPKPRNRLFG